MRRGSVFDPRFITHVQPTVNGFMTARCKVFRPNQNRPGWVPGVGNTDGAFDQIWEGICRAQPNIDWRARVRDFEGEYDATMAVRIDLPMNMNEYGATRDVNGNITRYGADPNFALGDLVNIVKVAGPGQDTLLNKEFTVRNALPSTTMFQHNLLCDVGTSLHG